MPKLIRLYMQQVAVGFALSALFLALLLGLNIANLWHLVTSTQGGLVAAVMLWVFNGIVFAGVQFGITIMRLAEEDDTPRGGHRQGVPVAVKVAATRTVPQQMPRSRTRRF